MRNILQTPSKSVTASGQEFRVDGESVALYSGAVHYWRLERSRRDDLLEKVKAMGFTTISTYVPWEVHEIERGQFDFGTRNAQNDLDAFLTLCELKKLYVIARPGPQINSELTSFGYPRRILQDPDLWALNAHGGKAVLTQVPRPIPALSYASEKFFAEAAAWYDAVCPILVRHKYPAGNLVAVQVDNEMAFFFHINAYACDYSRASVERYRAFLKEKYQTSSALPEAYGRTRPSFDDIQPPRRFEGRRREDVPYYADWSEYRERYLIDCLARLAQMLRDRGLNDLPLFHNYPHPLGPGGAASGITAPFNLIALEEKLDYVGFDIYSRKELYDHVKTVVSYVVGSSRYPYIPEFIAGVWPWYLHPGDLQDTEFVTRAALMHGIKGFSRYMIVERDRWLASPVRRDGRVRKEDYAMFRNINDVVTKYQLARLERQAEVLLLANREYDRLEAASVLVSFPGDFLESPLGFSEYPSFMNVSERTLGFAQPIQLAKSEWFSQCGQQLTAAGYAFVISDTALPLERLRRFKVIAVSAFEYMESALQRKLVEFAQSGGLLVLGPKVPSLDERMQHDDTLLAALGPPTRMIRQRDCPIGAEHLTGAGRIVHLEGPLSDPWALVEALQDAALTRIGKNDARLDVVVHRPRDATRRMVVFVANPSAESIEARIGVDVDIRSATEIWSERATEVQGGSWRDTLPPYTIHTYELLW